MKWLATSLIVFLAGAGGYFVWQNWGEPIPELETLPGLVYERVTDEIVADVQVPPGAARVLLPPFPRDAQDALRHRVREALEEKRGLEVEAPPRRSEVLEGSDDWDALLGAVFDEWKKKLISEWKGEKPEFVVLARVQDYVDDDDRVRLDVEWERRLLSGGDATDSGKSFAEIRKSWVSVDYARSQISSWSGPGRFGLWVLAVVGPPFALMGFIRKVLERNSNLANARLLLALMIPGSVAAWILTAFGWGWLGGSLTLLGVAGAAVFAFFFCTAVENLRQ